MKQEGTSLQCILYDKRHYNIIIKLITIYTTYYLPGDDKRCIRPLL